jgi:hypothetical protein
MRAIFATIAMCSALAACSAPQVPNDQDQYFDNITPDPTALAAENNRLRAAETGGTTSTQNVQLPGDTGTATQQAVVTENAEISQTQDFKVVTQKETIASDAAKLAALKQTYKVIEPEALPQRRGQSVNLAAYALSQKHSVGTKKFRRFSGSGGCGRYRNDPDAAQREFLKSGGPAKDRKRLDGDGDGFACGWNPDKYRSLLQNVEATPAVTPTVTELPSTDS